MKHGKWPKANNYTGTEKPKLGRAAKRWLARGKTWSAKRLRKRDFNAI